MNSVRLSRLGKDTSMSFADATSSRKQPPDGEGAYVVSSPTRGVMIYVTPGGLKLLLRFFRWLLAIGGLLIYAGTT